MKDNIIRGMLVRSLGIEAQAFKLVCHTGYIKPEEEKTYAKMYGSGKAEFDLQCGDVQSSLVDKKSTSTVNQ